ncbi:SURF1 family protein [Corynebacterium durum]|uniref:SURF1 family cytochrome oxidase biogenesis protein n=1 Tax=Corynebacterium durum TaxID=61592 RepID=UPI0028F046DE|nr:SURF1 family protein [Corynebacterium durum]
MNSARPHPSTQRSVWKTFLKPGWVFTAAAVLIFAYFAFTVLAPWQLHKNEAKTERNHNIEAAFETDPVPLSEIFTTRGKVADGKEWRRVSMTGHYLPESEVLLRLRPVNSSPAFQALTPFRLNSGEIMLVNRGFVPANQDNVPDIPAAPSEEVTIVGYARLDEPPPSHEPLTDQGRLQVSGINSQQIADLTHLELGKDYVQLSDGQPGTLSAIPLPQLDSGPHLSYGIQWIAFGIMAPLGLGYFVWAEMRERRREQEEQQALQEQQQTPLKQQDEKDQQEPESPAEAKLRSRYGGARVDHYSKIARRNEERF